MNLLFIFILLFIILICIIAIKKDGLQVIIGKGPADYTGHDVNSHYEFNSIARNAVLEHTNDRDPQSSVIGFNPGSAVINGSGREDAYLPIPLFTHKYSSKNNFTLPDDLEIANSVSKNKFSYPKITHKYVSGKKKPATDDSYKYDLSWMKYKTWADLRSSKKHYNAYNDCRRAILQNKHLDWSKINSTIIPKLRENFEYIGTIDIQPDGKTLYISSLKRSPIIKGKNDNELVYASIPNDLVATMSNCPALFLFHTHPDDVHCDPMPSSEDISTSIFFAAINRYAANVIISAYGIILYSASGYVINMINGFSSNIEWESAVLNFSHDVVAAHETIRSWSAYTLRDYMDFYSRYNLFIYIYPSSRFVAERGSTRPNLHKQIDHHIIHRHHEDIIKHEVRKK
jgi:hypothetical protein